jgi:alpha-1,2-glucosyltransferase
MNFINRYKEPLLFLLIGLSLLCTFLYLKNCNLLVDENDSYKQIQTFREFRYELEEISAMPTYFYVMAMLSKLAGNGVVGAVRAITLLFSFITIGVFYLCAKIMSPKKSAIKTLQFVFLPVLFIFFFLLYTEVFSLLFVLLAFYYVLKKNYLVAGVFGIISMAVRQNNVMWLAFISVFIYVEANGFTFSMALAKEHLRKTWVFVLGFILFVAFVIWNGGVAIGDADKHPGKLSVGNIYFSLFTFVVIFLPLVIAKLKEIWLLLKSNKAAQLFVFVSALLFYLFFKCDHPYNNIDADFFLRNMMLSFFMQNTLLQWVFFAISLLGALCLMTIKLHEKEYYLMYAFAVLFLLPSWLIDVRYYIIPLVLFVLFKKESNKYVEHVTIIYFLVMSAWLLKMARTETWFL